MRDLVVFDIDGCLLNNDARLPLFLEGRYDEFKAAWRKDVPIEVGVTLCRMFLADPVRNVIFITSRNESQREITLHQLREFVSPWLATDQLIMRPDNVSSYDSGIPGHTVMPDHEFKPWALRELAGFALSDVFFVYEDLDAMVDEWRRLGVTCLQPARRTE